MTSPADRTDADRSEVTTGRTVVGMFHDRSRAEQAIRDLKDAGFREEQIGVALQDQSEQKELMESSGAQAAEGAATGAVSGGIVGGLIGLLGSLLIPGLGPIVVGGVLASTLTGVGIGAATGGLIGALVGMGVPEADAQHFDTGLRSGGILLTVSAGERTPEALTILQRHGADFGPSGLARFGGTPDTDWTEADTVSRGAGTAGSGAAAASTDFDDNQRLELREEQLDIEKEQVQAGEVRLRKEVVTEQRSFEVPVTREETYQGRERRRRQESSYAGPERRLVGV